MSKFGDLFIRHPDGEWASPDVTGYTNEAHLQQLLAGSPEHIPGVRPGSVAVCEMPLEAGWADIVVVGEDGDLTVVECKLEKNPEKRRMVIGQVIDYAASISAEGFKTFCDRWSQLAAPLDATLSEAAMRELERNLSSGAINMCIAVDVLDDDLRRLVEYLSKITLPVVRVTALEVRYISDGGVEIILPSAYGLELAEAKAPPTSKWTKETFLAAAPNADERAAVATLFDRAESTADGTLGVGPVIAFGKETTGGVRIAPYGVKRAPFSLWIEHGHVQVYGQWQSYDDVANPDGYAAIAQALGQSHLGRATAVPISSVDLANLWTAALTTAVVANGHVEATE